MKLVLVIVAEPLVDDLLSDLTRSHYQVTLISTTGGFLRRGNATLLIGVQPGDVEAVLATVQSRVRAGNPPSSATTFVLRTESHVRV